MDKPRLLLIDGGKTELERKRRLLFCRPWVFGHDEFVQLCELFKLSRAEAFDLMLMRIGHRARNGSREAAAILAIFADKIAS